MNRNLLTLCLMLIVIVVYFLGLVPAAAQTPPGQDVPGSLPWSFVPGNERLAVEVFVSAIQTGLISDYSVEWVDNPSNTKSLVLWMKYDHTRHDLLFVRDAILCQLEYMFVNWRYSCPVG